MPLIVRTMLNLRRGDSVLFQEAKDGAIQVRKAEALDLEFLRALQKTLTEWDSDADQRAYRDL